MPVEAVVKCAGLSNVKYVKEGNTSMHHFLQLVNALGKSRVFAGSTQMMFRQMLHGVQGAVLGQTQIWPEAAVELFSTIQRGDIEKARMLYYEKHLALVEACSLGGWHTQAIKAALKARGVIENDVVRGPTQQMDEVSKKELLLWLESKGLIGER
jgi:dihydrodipicolinate synthase/N-acetylneuraminate lyase